MRDLTSLEKSCILQLIIDDYTYESMIRNEGIHPVEALERFGWLMDSQHIAEGVWFSILCEKYLQPEEGIIRAETKDIRLCGKDNIINYAKAQVEKMVSYANSKLSRKERVILFFYELMFTGRAREEAQEVINSIVD